MISTIYYLALNILTFDLLQRRIDIHQSANGGGCRQCISFGAVGGWHVQVSNNVLELLLSKRWWTVLLQLHLHSTAVFCIDHLMAQHFVRFSNNVVRLHSADRRGLNTARYPSGKPRSIPTRRRRFSGCCSGLGFPEFDDWGKALASPVLTILRGGLKLL